MTVKDGLVAAKRAEPHHTLPHSGWVTLRFKSEEDIKAAVRLFHLSYDIARRQARDFAQSLFANPS